MTSWELLSHRWFWVLVHSLWQQSLVAIGLWVILRFFAVRSAERRYAVALGVFAISALLPVVTWAWMSPSDEAGATVAPAFPTARSAPPPELEGKPDSVSPPDVVNVDSTARSPAPATSSSAAVPVPGRSRAWIVLLACWCAGATIQLARTVRDLSATAALLRDDTLRDPELLKHVERAGSLLQLRRRFEVLISAAGVGPFVFGLWKPTLVLPAVLLTNLPSDQLEAILLHELAHLRRYDDVVNLLQRLIEAVFFFNPALLWMSRVLRREREAACDARAVDCIGSPFSLAEALVRVAEALGNRPQPALTALNFADAGNSGDLLDRVRRIVRPNERPRLRLTWPALIGSLFLLGLLCVGLERATFWSIALAKDWLSPEQRIAAVAEILGDFKPTPVARETAERLRLKGSIRPADGAPLLDGLGQLCSISRRKSVGGTSTANASYDCRGEQFDVSVDPGECWLMYYNNNYAPAIVGPFRGTGGDVKNDIEIVLKAGSPGAIRVVDAKGTPIADATVTALPDWGLDSIVGPSLPEKTDPEGVWKSDHLADTPYRLTIRAPGFSTFNSPKAVRITSQPADITLDPSDPIKAIVVDQQGNPVAGARVGMIAARKPGSESNFGGYGNLVAESREDGTFQLDDVSLDCTYDLLIDAGEKGHALAGPLRADGKRVRIELQKKLTLAGQLRGAPGELAAARKEHIRCLGPLDGTSRPHHSSTGTIDEEGHFRFDSLFPGNYQMSIGRSVVIKGELNDSKDDLVIDLKELHRSQRDVEVRFMEEGKPVTPGGSIGVQMEILDEGGQRVFGGPREIVDGRVRVRLWTPDTLRLIPDGCLGYWFDEVSLPVPAGDEPFVAEIPVLPAGAVRVKVLSPAKRGEARPQVGAGVQFVVPSAIGERSIWFHRTSGAGDEVVLSPVPLDVPCRVSASQEYRRVFSPVFQLEGAVPVREMTLALPSAIDAVIRVESPSGEAQPRIPLEVNYSPPATEPGGPRNLPPGGMTWQNNQLITDREGRATLIGLPANEDGYSITAKSLRDWQPGTAAIRTDGNPTVLTLLRGKILEGKVVDEKTGQGVPAISIRAIPAVNPRRGSLEFLPEGPTDSEGFFRFSNLPDERVKLLPFAVRHRTQPEAIPGANEPVVVEIQVP